MQISGDLKEFSTENIDQAPDKPGVYALYVGVNLIYIGRAEGGLGTTTLRARLKGHYEGQHGRFTKQATHYRCEVNPDPITRERELLKEYEGLHGRVPKCNPVSYLPRSGGGRPVS